MHLRFPTFHIQSLFETPCLLIFSVVPLCILSSVMCLFLCNYILYIVFGYMYYVCILYYSCILAYICTMQNYNVACMYVCLPPLPGPPLLHVIVGTLCPRAYIAFCPFFCPFCIFAQQYMLEFSLYIHVAIWQCIMICLVILILSLLLLMQSLYSLSKLFIYLSLVLFLLLLVIILDIEHLNTYHYWD